MNVKTPIAVLAVVGLSTAGCGGDDDATAGTTPPRSLRRTAGRSRAAVLFAEPFDDDGNGWGIIDRPGLRDDGVRDGDYVWGFRGSVGHLLPEVLAVQYDSGQLEMLDVIVRASATIVSGGGVIGVFCREVPDTDADFQWYEFVARDGFAAIRKADSEGNLEVLAETEDVRLPLGEPIAFEAACMDDANGNAGAGDEHRRRGGADGNRRRPARQRRPRHPGVDVPEARPDGGQLARVLHPRPPDLTAMR